MEKSRERMREGGACRLGEVVADERPRAGMINLLELLQPWQKARVVNGGQEIGARA